MAGRYNPYSQGPPQDAGQGLGQVSPYGGDQHELQPVSNYQQPPQQQYNASSQNAFLDQVQELYRAIQDLDELTAESNRLQQRALSGSDAQAQQQIEQNKAQAQRSRQAIRDGLRRLKDDIPNTHDISQEDKTRHVDTLQRKATTSLHKNLAAAQQNQRMYEAQAYHQLEITNPELSPQEREQLVQGDYGGREGIFQTVLMNSRSSEARTVLGNVEARNREIQSLENEVSEIALLMQEVAVMVEQQEQPVQNIEQNAEQTVENMEAGNQQVKIATDHARRARKLKWWCLLICIIIVIVVALGVGLGICLNSNKCGGK